MDGIFYVVSAQTPEEMSTKLVFKRNETLCIDKTGFLVLCLPKELPTFFWKKPGTYLKVKLILFRVSTGHFGIPNLSRYNMEVFPVWGRATQTV